MQCVAQLEECRRRKPEAAGSCPATLTNNNGDCGVVVCIARCERAGPGSKPGDRPIASPPTDGNLGIPRCLRNSGFCVRIAGWGPNRGDRARAQHCLASIASRERYPGSPPNIAGVRAGVLGGFISRTRSVRSRGLQPLHVPATSFPSFACGIFRL
jgi:hypothetical protein